MYSEVSYFWSRIFFGGGAGARGGVKCICCCIFRLEKARSKRLALETEDIEFCNGL